jgi:hypothetical protein
MDDSLSWYERTDSSFFLLLLLVLLTILLLVTVALDMTVVLPERNQARQALSEATVAFEAQRETLVTWLQRAQDERDGIKQTRAAETNRAIRETMADSAEIRRLIHEAVALMNCTTPPSIIP